MSSFYIEHLFEEIDTNKPKKESEALKTLTKAEEKLLASYIKSTLKSFRPTFTVFGPTGALETIFNKLIYTNIDLFPKFESIFEKLEFTFKPVALHYYYNALCDFYYKKRKDNPQYFEKTKEICIKDLYIFPDYYEKIPFAYLPTVPRLISILKQQGRIDDAINVCKFALFFGITDTHSATGYKGRLERLLKLKKAPQ